MKKALYFTLAAFILTVMVFHSMPVRAVELSFNGEYRVRAYAYDMNGLNEQDDARTYYDQRFRLVLTATASENLKGVLRIVAPNNDTWGTFDSENTSNPWEGSVDYDLAYLEFSIPNTNLNAKIGKQFLKLGNYIVMGSYATYDSIVVSTKIENVDISLFTAKLYEGSIHDAEGPSEDDEDLYGLTLGVNAAPNMNFGFFAVILNDGALDSGYIGEDDIYGEYSDSDAFWLGLTADMDYAPLKFKFEVDYASYKANSEIVDDIEGEGFAVFADICAELEFAKVGVAALMTTGQDRDHFEKNEDSAFYPIGSRFSYFYEWDLLVINKFLEDAYDNQCITNLTTYKVYAMKDFTPKTSGTLSVQTYSYTEDANLYDADEQTRIGVEIDAIVTHQLYENLELKAGAGYWITDKETYDPATETTLGKDNEDNWILKLALLFEF